MDAWQSVNFAICSLMIRHSLSSYSFICELWARNRELKDNFRAYFPSRRFIFRPIVKSVHLRLFKNHIGNWQKSCFLIFSCKSEFIQSKWVVWCLSSQGRLKSTLGLFGMTWRGCKTEASLCYTQPCLSRLEATNPQTQSMQSVLIY